MNTAFEMQHALLNDRTRLAEYLDCIWCHEEFSQSPAERAFVRPLFEACASLLGRVWAVHVWQQLERRGRRPDWFLSIVPWGHNLPHRNPKKLHVTIEIDGKRYHSDENTFQRDREKDRQAARDGITTLRYAAAEVLNGHCAIAADLAALIDRLNRAAA
jgi:hypothetical protein